MKIAILDADHLSPSIIRRYGNYADKIIHLLSPMKSQLQNNITFSRYDATKRQLPKSLSEYNLYIITGSQYSTYENKQWIRDLEKLIIKIHNKKIKLIGICFGHQLIAQSLGGKVEKNPKGWELGITATHILNTYPWMEPSREFLFTLVSHQDQIIQLPEDAIHFAETNLCKYSGYTIGNHILGMQCHPEFSKKYVRLIIQLQSKQLSSQDKKSAISSLNQATDQDVISRWLIHFSQNQVVTSVTEN